MNIPYVKAGAPFIDHPSSGDATFAAVEANTMDDGIYAAHLQPAVRVYHSANQSINNTTETALAFNSERFDQASNAASTMHDTSSNNSRLTCRYAGVYAIFGHWNWANSAAGSVRHGAIRLAGSTFLAMQSTVPLNGVFGQSISTLYTLAVNDYVELTVYQDTGGALNVLSTGNYTPEFGMVRVG